MQVIDANGNMFGYDSITVAGPDGRPKTLSSAIKLVSLVRNQTGATLTKGTIVYINGGSGNKPTVTKALATSDATSAQTYGVLQADIANNKNGYVVVIGSLEGLNTSAYAPGTQLYLSSTVAGTWTSTKQLAPAHLVYVGIVVRQHVNQGVVEVKIQNGYELDEIHDVQILSPVTGDTLIYDSTSGLWKNGPGGGGGGGGTVLVTASPYTPTSSDYYIYVDMLTPCVINLPAIASANPSGYNIKNIGESTVKIVPLISEPIDDQAEINIKNAYTSLDIVHTTTNWYIV
jgi:ribosomal protein L35AE/L33A